MWDRDTQVTAGGAAASAGPGGGASPGGLTREGPVPGQQPRLAPGSSASCPQGVPWASCPAPGRPDLTGWVMFPPPGTVPFPYQQERPGCEASFCNAPALWPWTRYPAFLTFTFLLWKTGIFLATHAPRQVGQGCKKVTWVRMLGECEVPTLPGRRSALPRTPGRLGQHRLRLHRPCGNSQGKGGTLQVVCAVAWNLSPQHPVPETPCGSFSAPAPSLEFGRWGSPPCSQTILTTWKCGWVPLGSRF